MATGELIDGRYSSTPGSSPVRSVPRPTPGRQAPTRRVPPASMSAASRSARSRSANSAATARFSVNWTPPSGCCAAPPTSARTSSAASATDSRRDAWRAGHRALSVTRRPVPCDSRNGSTAELRTSSGPACAGRVHESASVVAATKGEPQQGWAHHRPQPCCRPSQPPGPLLRPRSIGSRLYSTSQVIASNPVGSVELPPVLSPFLPASMGARRRR